MSEYCGSKIAAKHEVTRSVNGGAKLLSSLSPLRGCVAVRHCRLLWREHQCPHARPSVNVRLGPPASPPCPAPTTMGSVRLVTE